MTVTTSAKVIPLPVRTPRKRISVVMVTYHTGAALSEAINATLADRDVFEVILVDNGNSMAARKRLWTLVKDRKRLRVLQGQGNVGFGRACNYGARMAKGDYILFLNPDAVIDVGAAMAMADCGEKLTRPWITGGYLKTIYGQEQRGARRKKLTPLSAIVSFTPLHKLPGFSSIHLESTPLPERPGPMPVVSGACMMTDRESFKMIGGFDEEYFLHVEDIDLCRRSRMAGGDVYFVPEAKAMHYGSTSKVGLRRVEHEKFKGFKRYFWNYSPKWWAKCLLVFSVPFMYVGLMGRAWLLTIKKAFEN